MAFHASRMLARGVSLLCCDVSLCLLCFCLFVWHAALWAAS